MNLVGEEGEVEVADALKGRNGLAIGVGAGCGVLLFIILLCCCKGKKGNAEGNNEGRFQKVEEVLREKVKNLKTGAKKTVLITGANSGTILLFVVSLI